MKLQHLLVWLLLLLNAGQAWAQGTLVKDIFPLGGGSMGYDLETASIGNKLLFGADNSVNGHELWISDGTDAGTFMLKDIVTGTRTASSNPQSFFNHRGIVYFYTRPSTTFQYEFWRSDGTATGTVKIGGDETYRSSRIIIDSTLYFVSTNLSATLNGLTQKDLLKGGYKVIVDYTYNSDIYQYNPLTDFNRLGNKWLFLASSTSNDRGPAIFISDGTKVGTKRIAPIKASGYLPALKTNRLGTLAFYFHDDGSFGSELWVTDGTETGSKIVKNIAPGGLSSINTGYPISALKNGVLFVANDGVTGNEIWISDGTDSGTKLFKEFTPGSNGTQFYFIDLGDDLVYFIVNGQLWRTDGTETGTFVIGNGGVFGYLRKEGNFIYYLDNADRVIRSNGQPNNSQVVGTLTNRYKHSSFQISGSNIFYSGYTDATGIELWKLPFCDHQATITAPVGASFCTGSSIDLQASGSGGAGPFTYQWKSGTSDLGTNAKLTVDKAGTYSLDVKDSKGCTVSTSIQASQTTNLPVGIGGPTAYCAGTTVPLSSTVAGGTAPYTYRWLQFGSPVSGATSASLLVNTSATYSLSVSDSRGCTGTSVGLSVSQKPSPAATISASGPTVVAPGNSLSVILTTPAASGQTYQWSRNGATLAGATNNSYLATQPGDYTVEVNRDGCSVVSSVSRLAVGLAVSITGPPNFCLGGSTTLVVAATTGDAPYTYRWQLGNTTVGTGNSLVVSAVGNYSVTVTDNKGVTGTLPAVVVTQRLTPEATIFANGSLLLQPGASVVLTAPTIAGQTYQWFRNGTAIAGATGNTYTANTAGDYTVMVTRDGCSATSVPTRVSLALVAAITGANQICGTESTTLVAGATNGDAPFTYQWRVNGSVLNVLGNTLVVNTAGNYAVTITDSKGQIGIAQTITVSQKPLPNTAISVVGQLPLQPGTSAVLSIVSVPSQTYQWLKDGAAISGATANSYTITQAGSYAVRVNRDGCSATSLATVISIITAIEPGAEGIGMEVSPNPASEVCRVKVVLDKAAPIELQLINAGGKAVRAWSSGKAARTHETTLSISDLPAGLYLVRATANDRRAVSKLLKN